MLRYIYCFPAQALGSLLSTAGVSSVRRDASQMPGHTSSIYMGVEVIYQHLRCGGGEEGLPSHVEDVAHTTMQVPQIQPLRWARSGCVVAG
jgi:hypothetical protein